jgi:hypothetical protein
MTKRQADLLLYWLITRGDITLGFTRLHEVKIELYPDYNAATRSDYSDITNSSLGASNLVAGEQGMFHITDKAKKLLQEMTNEQRIDSGTAD